MMTKHKVQTKRAHARRAVSTQRVAARNAVLSHSIRRAPKGMAYKVTGPEFEMLTDHGGMAVIAAEAIAKATGVQTHVMLGSTVVLSGKPGEV